MNGVVISSALWKPIKDLLLCCGVPTEKTSDNLICVLVKEHSRQKVEDWKAGLAPQPKTMSTQEV